MWWKKANYYKAEIQNILSLVQFSPNTQTMFFSSMEQISKGNSHYYYKNESDLQGMLNNTVLTGIVYKPLNTLFRRC